MANIHQKSKSGVWYISYRQGGILKHRSLGTKSAAEARRLKREIELKAEFKPSVEFVIVERPKADVKNPTLDAFWTDFLRWATEHRSRNAVDEYTNWFRQFREFTKIERLGDATVDQVREFKTRIRTQGKGKPEGTGLCETSVNSALKTLRSIWNHAIRLNKYTGPNPFLSAEFYRIPQHVHRDYLDGKSIESLLKATEHYAQEKGIKTIEARNIRLAIALMALAGLRKREACFARWEWIRWDTKIIEVSNHGEFTTKSRRNRTISMHDDLIAILAPHRRGEGYILEATRATNGKNRYRVEFKKSFQRVCAIAGFKATPHALRHSFASRHAVAGTSLHVIAGWLGHSSTSITERYAHFQTGYNEAANNI
ncbi:MAG: site-specific integrase [Candidatus Hydrogenedentes bacterium]|nr:site-specific integrase [Candidatus Hydrogenedentota bacterium]